MAVFPVAARRFVSASETGPYMKEFHSLKSGHITEVDNAIINRIAKSVGCPFSKTSGIEIIKGMAQEKNARAKYPDAVVMAHPECTEQVRKVADKLLSTGQMLNFAKENDIKQGVVVMGYGTLAKVSIHWVCHNQWPPENNYNNWEGGIEIMERSN